MVGCLGIGLERAIFRPLRSNPVMALIASLGLMFILQVVILLIFGTHFKSVPVAFPQVVNILGSSIQVQRVIVIVAGVALLVLLGVFLQRTKYGLAILACAEDSEAATLQGMSYNTSSAITMMLSAGLAGIAGALGAPLATNIDPWMGTYILMKSFIIVIVGGAGSIKGALVIAFLLGFIESTLTSLGEPTLTVFVSLIIVLVILTFKPEGLFGGKQ
jgi:branched-chain amino acid transport system permease protein